MRALMILHVDRSVSSCEVPKSLCCQRSRRWATLRVSRAHCGSALRGGDRREAWLILTKRLVKEFAGRREPAFYRDYTVLSAGMTTFTCRGVDSIRLEVQLSIYRHLYVRHWPV